MNDDLLFRKNIFISCKFLKIIGNNMDSIINNIYSSYDGIDLYNSVEEKGANLLYLAFQLF